jgi:hypothetical protein
VVGAFGVVNTLTMNVLEQTRELGLLRIVAMTKRFSAAKDLWKLREDALKASDRLAKFLVGVTNELK